MNINEQIKKLKSVSDSPRLDVELLLMYVLGVTRAQLMLLDDIQFTDEQEKQFTLLFERRLKGEPMAYIFGEQEFWSLNFYVTPDVLIPRPDTEYLVEYILSKYKDKSDLKIADIGTGSGAIAVSLAHERSSWVLHATDISEKALAVAKRNAEKHQLRNIEFHQGYFCEALPGNDYDIIVSNPPYIEKNDPHLKALVFEPVGALVSGDDGLDAIREIAQSAKKYLKKNGLIVLEHGYNQASSVQEVLRLAGYDRVASHFDLAGNERFTSACF